MVEALEPPLGRELEEKEEEDVKMPPNPRIRPPADRECMDADAEAASATGT